MAERDLAEPQQLPLAEPVELTPEVEPESPEIVAIRNQLVDSQRRETESNARLEAANARFDTYLSRPPAQETHQVQRVDPATAPDPAVDPEAFSRHQAALHAQSQRDLNKQIADSQQRIEQQSQQSINQMQQSHTANQVWSEFQAAYPEHAHQKDIATMAFNRAFPSGMPSDTSGVLNAVKTKMQEMIGTPTSAPNRTGGIGGGSPPPRHAAPNKEEQAPKSMIDMMLDSQLEQGII